jgi:hypothetical protein
MATSKRGHLLAISEVDCFGFAVIITLAIPIAFSSETIAFGGGLAGRHAPAPVAADAIAQYEEGDRGGQADDRPRDEHRRGARGEGLTEDFDVEVEAILGGDVDAERGGCGE